MHDWEGPDLSIIIHFPLRLLRLPSNYSVPPQLFLSSTQRVSLLDFTCGLALRSHFRNLLYLHIHVHPIPTPDDSHAFSLLG